MESSRNLDHRSSRDIEEAIDASATGPDHQHKTGDRSIPPSPRRQPDQQTELVGLPENINSARHLEIEKVIVLSFRSLQLQRISQLQDDLLRLTLSDAAGNAPPDHTEKVDKALEDYAKALRNYETLSLNALPEVPRGATLVGSILSVARPEPSPSALGKLLVRFANRLKRSPGLSSILQWLQAHQGIVDTMILLSPVSMGLAWGGVRLFMTLVTVDTGPTPSRLMEAVQQVVGNLGFRELDWLGRQKRSQKAALTERIIMAMFGGVALITPMLIMTLHPSTNVSLITTSLATFLFALILAFGATESAGKDVLAATAAYAAVLVVFVGTNSAGP